MGTLVTRVGTIYGDHFHVAAADLANPAKILLPLYTSKGVKWTERTDSKGRVIECKGATSLHRDNIGPKQTEAESLAAVEAILAGAL